MRVIYPRKRIIHDGKTPFFPIAGDWVVSFYKVTTFTLKFSRVVRSIKWMQYTDVQLTLTGRIRRVRRGRKQFQFNLCNSGRIKGDHSKSTNLCRSFP